MKIQTTDLDGPALNWAVSVCEGYTLTTDSISLLLEKDNKLIRLCTAVGVQGPAGAHDYAPRENWAHGGPIFDREIFSHSKDDLSETRFVWHKDGKARARGPNLLTAAMRCYVLHKKGPVIDVPLPVMMAWKPELVKAVPDQAADAPAARKLR